MNEDSHNPKEDETDLQQKAAANVVRAKLHKLYNTEPDVSEEIQQVERLEPARKKSSPHHQYLDKLSKSNQSLAEVTAAWHKYYQGLSDEQKHEVWNEFYEMHNVRRQKPISDIDEKTDPTIINPTEKKTDSGQTAEAPQPAPQQSSRPALNLAGNKRPQINTAAAAKKAKAIKNDLLGKVASRAKQTDKKSHFHSLAFGLGMGSLVVFILLFSFFNERFITPFIRPSQNVSATPIIVDPNQTTKVGKEPKIIIPKINVEVPVIYDEPSIEEEAIQKALNRGVVHYATTPNPGENGNAVIFGHSSSNILNSGRYKFAFLLLKSLDEGDTFFVNKDGKRYVYKVYKKFVTSPTDFSVLDAPKDKKAIMTLITCDPPGLSTNRLIVQAEQIFPDVSKNSKSSVDPAAREATPEQLPSNSVSLWQRVKDWF